MRFLLFFLLLFLNGHLAAQVDPSRITIARDRWGVPHIFAPTDAEVAYGFTWATAEDDFRTMQELLLPIRGLAGLVLGKNGAVMDVAVHLIESRPLVEARYATDLSPEFRTIVEAYAETHPREVLHRKLFPIDGKDIIQGYVLGLTLMSGVDNVLSGIPQGRYDKPDTSDARYDWQGVLPGDTSATLWDDRYYPIDSLPQVLDPPSGYVYNCNHTPFLSSGPADNPDPSRIPRTTGYQAPDVLAAVYSQPDGNSRLRAVAGDSYIQLLRFSPQGVEIESVNAYGASAKAESPHYTDQMELFTHQQLKPMTLDKEAVLREAERVYHPAAKE